MKWSMSCNTEKIAKLIVWMRLHIHRDEIVIYQDIENKYKYIRKKMKL